MRWLIVNTDYDDFLRWLYAAQPELARATYAEQLAARLATRFGIGDALSHSLRALGHEAEDVFANNEPLQRRWALEHRVWVPPEAGWDVTMRGGLVPWPRRQQRRRWLRQILAAQVRRYRPDVLYCLALETVGGEFLRSLRPHCGLAVGQHAAMVPGHEQWRPYDLVVSSLPNLVEHFRAHGVASVYLPLAFDERVLEELGEPGAQAREPNPADAVREPRRLDVVFVGGLAGVQHDGGARLVERVRARCPVRVWGYGAEELPANSPLRGRCGPPLWGVDMYRALRAAKIVLNRHGPIALDWANNLRLFEATGVGTLLLTDAKRNLGELFEPGREVVAYRSADEAAELARHYLEHECERERIAAAGQARTLREHTYAQRARRLVELVSEYGEYARLKSGAKAACTVP